MPKMGPAYRKPTNEAQTKKDIEAFIKAEDALLAKRDWAGMMARVDFPVFMVTDTLAGVPSAMETSREQYEAEMKPMWEMMPPGSSTKHKLTISVLSDSLANVVDDYEMTMGKEKSKARNTSVLVKVGGQWKYKMMMEAGWGDSSAAPSASPAAPAPTAAPAPAAQGNRPPAPAPTTGAPAPAPTGAPAPAPSKGAAPPPPPPAKR
jgi:hypothetical protein